MYLDDFINNCAKEPFKGYVISILSCFDPFPPPYHSLSQIQASPPTYSATNSDFHTIGMISEYSQQ